MKKYIDLWKCLTKNVCNMDNQYYKKNAQLRYQISRELDIYKKNKETSVRNQYDPIIRAIFSSISSIATSYAGYEADIIDCAKPYIIPIILLASLPVYMALFKIIYIIKNKICAINKDAFKKLNINQHNQLIAKFDFDISGLIYMSYIIATDKTSQDKLLIEYNKGEALFYIERSLKKLRSVFISNLDYIPALSEFRIKNNMELLKASIVAINFDISDKTFKVSIHNAIVQYNEIVDTINKKYQNIRINHIP